MNKLLLSALSLLACSALSAQITVTQADYGSAGDSLITASDSSLTGVSVGGTGMQTWDFSGLSVANISTLKFVDPANTASGNNFPNADLAIERETDTLFFESTASLLAIDGVSGDGFNTGTSIIADFNPDATQITFPSTFQTTFVDTAVFDTVLSCAAVGQTICDSAHLRRRVIITSEIDAYGDITTPGDTYASIRQYYREDNSDSLAIGISFGGQLIWQTIVDSTSTTHNYRWIANGEDWPVMTAVADAQNGNIVSATFKIDNNVLGFIDSHGDPTCNGDCDGFIQASGLGGTAPYNFIWSNGATTSMVTGLCAGAYTVTITDAAAGQTTVSFTLEEPAEILVGGGTQGVSMGGDGAIQPSITGGTEPYTFAWTGPNGYTATTKNITGLDTGSYTLVVTDNNGCTGSNTFDIMLTGVEDLVANSYRLYPNPANTVLTLETERQIDQVTVYNLLGAPVYQESNISGKKNLNVSSLPQGVYTIVVSSEGKESYTRFTIKR